jgi:hypothetical protein
VQPRNQELLLQALGSDSAIVAAAAADTLQQLWRSMLCNTSAAATATAHAAALRQALYLLLHGSDSTKASAAEFCWLASASENNADLLVPQVVPVLTAALSEPKPAPWAVFAMAALCNIRERALQDAAHVLQLWLNGDAVVQQAMDPLLDAQLAEEEEARARRLAADATANADAAAAAAVQQKAAEWADRVTQLRALAEAQAPARKAVQAALPQGTVLLHCVLQALAAINSYERLASAAYQALQCASEHARTRLVDYALALLHEQFEDKEQQQQQFVSNSVKDKQPQSLVQLLLDCAPDLALLPRSLIDKPTYYSSIPVGSDAGQLWSKVVAAAPEPVCSAVAGSLQQQLLSAAAAADDASTVQVSSSSSGTGSNQPWWQQGRGLCFDCCSAATSHSSDRHSSAPHNAARLLQWLCESTLWNCNVLDPVWLDIVKLHAQAKCFASDPAAAEAIRVLQQLLLLRLASRLFYLAEDRLPAAAVDRFQQQLQAALAGNSEALAAVDIPLSKESGTTMLQY